MDALQKYYEEVDREECTRGGISRMNIEIVSFKDDDPEGYVDHTYLDNKQVVTLFKVIRRRIKELESRPGSKSVNKERIDELKEIMSRLDI